MTSPVNIDSVLGPTRIFTSELRIVIYVRVPRNQVWQKRSVNLTTRNDNDDIPDETKPVSLRRIDADDIMPPPKKKQRRRLHSGGHSMQKQDIRTPHPHFPSLHLEQHLAVLLRVQGLGALGRVRKSSFDLSNKIHLKKVLKLQLLVRGGGKGELDTNRKWPRECYFR